MYPNKHNAELNAGNVFELKLELPVIQEAYAEVATLLRGYFEGLRVCPESGIGLYSVCPGWNGNLRWISSGNQAGFAFFDKYFEKLKIQQLTHDQLGDHGELIMYSGFFVVRSHTEKSYYHEDYSTEVGMNAFTLMTPVKPTGEIGNLLYHDSQEEEQVYKYEQGKGVCFGGGFYHSTEPFESVDPYVFLCFTYGVTDSELWRSISETAAEQGAFYRHPQLGIVATDSN